MLPFTVFYEQLKRTDYYFIIQEKMKKKPLKKRQKLSRNMEEILAQSLITQVKDLVFEMELNIKSFQFRSKPRLKKYLLFPSCFIAWKKFKTIIGGSLILKLFFFRSSFSYTEKRLIEISKIKYLSSSHRWGKLKDKK